MAAEPVPEAVEAFTRLYAEYHKPLFAFVLRAYCRGDHECAAGIVQDLFLHVWSRWDDVPAKTDGNHRRNWLYRIAQQTWIKHYRYSHADKRSIDVTCSLEDSRVDPAAKNNLDLLLDLRKHVAKLPEDARVLFVLRAQGFSDAEIAIVMNIPIETVKSLYQRGLRQLRSAFQINKNLEVVK